ncbi:MAG TPA: hypothetical protein VMN36_01950 [Verrucomicrobiales bacterium]|nr:hypothetical protein [Verrucomicrobiales bacterium]
MQGMRYWLPWSNPVFLRYARSRLRLGILIPMALVTIVGTAFFFLLAYILARRVGWSVPDAARLTLIPVFLIQGVLLMLGGAAGVAVGITREADEGIMDYQRLTPMPAGSKILGYLLGLPVRAWVLFGLTVPFTVFGAVAGQVPLDSLSKVYGVFFSSVLLYHLTGLVAGSVVRRSWIAALVSVIMVLLLYFLLPFLARIGYVFFDYLTVRPVVLEQWPDLLPDPIRGPAVDFLRTLIPSVPFFGKDVSRWAFSLVVQGSLIFVFLVVVLRKWKNPVSHPLGKHFAVLVLAWFVALLLGNALPLVEDGRIFPSISLQLEQRLPGFGGRRALPGEALGLAGFFGLVSLGLVLGMVFAITPSQDENLRGLRRMRKLGLGRAPMGSDGAGAQGHALLMALLGMAAWLIFVWELFHSGRAPAVSFSLSGYAFLALVFLMLTASAHAVLEIWGRTWFLLAGLFAWIVPCLGAILLGTASSSLVTGGIYLTSLSGLALPFYAVIAPAGKGIVPASQLPHLRAACAVSFVLYAAVTATLLWRLRREHGLRRLRTAVADLEGGDPLAGTASVLGRLEKKFESL